MNTVFKYLDNSKGKYDSTVKQDGTVASHLVEPLLSGDLIVFANLFNSGITFFDN